MSTLLFLLLAAQSRNRVEAVPVAEAPRIDGNGNDACWAGAPESPIRVSRASMPGSDRYDVTMRAVYDGENAYMLFTWPDAAAALQHKRFEWSEEAGAFLVSDEIEDAFSIAFPIEGNFTADMYSADEAVWDVWHWGAARTNESGHALDRTHTMTLREPRRDPRGVRVTARNNEDLWIIRQDDRGTSCVERAIAPTTASDEPVLQYRPRAPDGSAADVRAAGRWDNGTWTVEFARALNTRQRDDAEFSTRREIAFGIATFDSEEDLEHRVSTVMQLRFRP